MEEDESEALVASLQTLVDLPAMMAIVTANRTRLLEMELQARL